MRRAAFGRGDAVPDQEVAAWIESTDKAFKAASVGDVWQKAFADFTGKDIGGYDLGFMFAVEACGHTVKSKPSGYVLDIRRG